jgi:dipeptidyl aminopeptidase/acylaminoacyl peptidase
MVFLSDAGTPGRQQLWLAAAGGGKARRATSLRGVPAAPAWSSDGRSVAFLFTDGASGSLGPLEAAPALTGVIEEEVRNQRLMVLDAASGAVRAVSPPDLHIYEFGWDPTSRAFAAVAAPGPGDNNWWIAQLYVVEAASGRMRSLYRPGRDTQIAVPRFAPDGASIAFIAGIMSDQGFIGGDVFLIAAAGGEPRNLTAGRPASASSIAWTEPGTLLVAEHAGGGSALATLDAASGRAAELWRGEEDLHFAGNFPNFAVSGRTSAWIRSSFSRPPEIWAGPIGAWKQVTHANDARTPSWGAAKSVSWSSDGFGVQGWLLYPKDFAPGRTYPLIVSVHGGPAGAKRSSWPDAAFDMTVMSGLGYFVLFPNPRGSYGWGERFTRANVKDFGGGDLRDILAGVDEVLRVAPVDPRRIGITGWSYGGFMTMFAVTQTTRFRAAVAGAGISNWQSYYGQNLIDQWMIPYFGASVYDDPAAYARASAINFIHQAVTPTLVVVGERDAECPAPQSFEFWHALKTSGVKTQLVVYKGEGHAFSDAGHRREVLARTAAWFEENMK